MTVADQDARTDVSATLERAGLPRDAVAAWLDSDDTLAADYRRDTEKFSRRWQIGAELLARLTPKPARSDAQAAAATTIAQRDRAVRTAFLHLHTEALYRRLTEDFSKFKRV